jgi:signal transduction histidine kinase
MRWRRHGSGADHDCTLVCNSSAHAVTSDSAGTVPVMSATPDYLWQALETQADDMFALYQLAQLLAEGTDLDELVGLALPQMVRVSDSAYAALFLQLGPERRLQLAGKIGPDFEVEDEGTGAGLQFDSAEAAMVWFRGDCGLEAADCLQLSLDVGRDLPGVLALAAPSRGGFGSHEHHLIATMAREVARVLHLALTRADLERRRRQVEQMQADFVTAVSHELRTPLALAQASVDSLTHLDLTPDQHRRSVEDIGRAVSQLSRIVDTILSFSRIEDGQWAVHLERVDLAAVVDRVIAELDAAHRCRLAVTVPHLEVLADADRLAQALSNLLSNALKYSPPAFPVRLRAHPFPQRRLVSLSVRDWGEGIPLEDQPFLFTRFFRARDVRESSHTGTGLGLYMAKRLIESQGGAIRLRSWPRKGTRVDVCLPTTGVMW